MESVFDAIWWMHDDGSIEVLMPDLAVILMAPPPPPPDLFV